MAGFLVVLAINIVYWIDDAIKAVEGFIVAVLFGAFFALDSVCQKLGWSK